MKILHLLSNAKWTGPAEPALNLCVALRRRNIEADFACTPHAGDSINKVVETARDRGIEPILRFRLAKHRRVVANFLDRRALEQFLSSHSYDIIHCHLDNAHRIAVRAAARAGLPLVRSSYDGEGLASYDAARLCAGTDWLIEPSQMAIDHDVELYGFPRERMTVASGGIDIERFSPGRPVPDGRRWLNIPLDAFVVGIVARLQRHRHFEDLFAALEQLVKHEDRIHAVVVGRGTHEQEVAREPVRRLGLEGHVHFPGYLEGEDYVGMLGSFDVKVFLVPGSDGACRAVKEAMAMAKPVVAADRGMLRELIDDGRNGYVVDGSPNSLYTVLEKLRHDRQLVRALGRGAREKAVRVFSMDAQAETVAEVYSKLMQAGRRVPA
jgi:glycosyltransferase involved in cell wall biosynthesis